MNITEIQFRNAVFGTLHASLSLTNPKNSDPYILKGYTGLDADEITPHVVGFNAVFGVNYYDMAHKERVITLALKINPQYNDNKTVGELRDDMYKTILSEALAIKEVRFMNGETALASLFGLVTKNESNQFSSDADFVITLSCPDPFLRQTVPVTLTDPPFVPDPEPGHIAINDYLSSAPHGYSITIVFTDDVTGIVMGYANGAEFNIAYFDFEEDDTLYVSNFYNNKYVYVIRGGTTINLMDKVLPGSVWPIIFPGENVLEFSVADYYYVSSISYYPSYWGI